MDISEDVVKVCTDPATALPLELDKLSLEKMPAAHVKCCQHLVAV